MLQPLHVHLTSKQTQFLGDGIWVYILVIVLEVARFCTAPFQHPNSIKQAQLGLIRQERPSGGRGAEWRQSAAGLMDFPQVVSRQSLWKPFLKHFFPSTESPRSAVALRTYGFPARLRLCRSFALSQPPTSLVLTAAAPGPDPPVAHADTQLVLEQRRSHRANDSQQPNPPTPPTPPPSSSSSSLSILSPLLTWRHLSSPLELDFFSLF